MSLHIHFYCPSFGSDWIKEIRKVSALLLKTQRLSSICHVTPKQQCESLATSISSLSMNLSAGIFNVDYSFLTSVISHIITYLVILLEFQGEHDDARSGEGTTPSNETSIVKSGY